MKILLFSIGSRGDVQPYIALGVELSHLRHEVILSTGLGFEDTISAHGLKPAPLSIDLYVLLQDPQMQKAITTLSGKIRAWKKMKSKMRTQYDEMWTIAREMKPDLIIVNAKCFAGVLIAKTLGVPAISTSLQPMFIVTKDYPSIFIPFQNIGELGNKITHWCFNLLVTLGLKAALGKWQKETLNLSGKLPNYIEGYKFGNSYSPQLFGYSAHLQPKPSDSSEFVHVTGYWFMKKNKDWGAPNELIEFLDAGSAPVYVGFGSMANADAEAQTKIIVEALRLSGQRGIIASGWGGLSDKLENLENVHFLKEAPHSWLFPKCSLIVHHGGAGTTHEAIRWGKPSLICPFGVDQPYWGRRVYELEIGAKAISQKKLTAKLLSQGILSALKPEIVNNAERFGDALCKEGGAKRAALIIDEFLHQ